MTTGLTLRNDINRKLTWDDLDGNFTYLENFGKRFFLEIEEPELHEMLLHLNPNYYGELTIDDERKIQIIESCANSIYSMVRQPELIGELLSIMILFENGELTTYSQSSTIVKSAYLYYFKDYYIAIQSQPQLCITLLSMYKYFMGEVGEILTPLEQVCRLAGFAATFKYFYLSGIISDNDEYYNYIPIELSLVSTPYFLKPSGTINQENNELVIVTKNYFLGYTLDFLARQPESIEPMTTLMMEIIGTEILPSINFSQSSIAKFLISVCARQPEQILSYLTYVRTFIYIPISNKNDIVFYMIGDNNVIIDKELHTVTVYVSNGTDVTTLTPFFNVSKFATSDPISGVEDDFTLPVTVVVTAEDGVSIQEWIVTVEILPVT